MRIPMIFAAAMLAAGCSGRSALDHSLDDAYQHYQAGDCDQVMLSLSKAERLSRSRSYLQPEISLLRGQCLERQGLFVDAAQTYVFIQSRYPASEYAYRARARLETLEQLGHYRDGQPAVSQPVKP